MLGKCAEAYPEWARLGKSDLRALADKNSPLGPESCARPIIFALKAAADPAFQLISPWEKVAFSATVGSFMDLRSRGAPEREVQQFFKDHLKFCTIVFREWLQVGAVTETRPPDSGGWVFWGGLASAAGRNPDLRFYWGYEFLLGRMRRRLTRSLRV